MMYKITVATDNKTELKDITFDVNRLVERENIKDGICVLYLPHTTAALVINENYDPSVKNDIMGWLGRNIPSTGNYSHLEGNADAHIKSSIVGNSLILIVENGRIMLGKWQGIFLAEFDGPRTREVWVKFISESRR
ncbi:YjbQ family protein [Candidatus Acetothermia bacterium]|nr:MAG: YjbQ family protein [Candidatus Acetothermia bacterium]